MEPLISVIVPIFFVEPQLRCCIDSIINQTYRNLEIILVDDGSPDECPAICDEYAKKDPRIKVIHKVNGGLSDARNAGLDVMRGEYVGFVDSDDYIAPDMYECLLDRLCAWEADIAVCEYFNVWEKSMSTARRESVRCFDGLEAQTALLRLQYGNYAWNKLYRGELWKDIRFPVGKNYEDVRTMYRLVARCRRVICLPEAKYYYLQNQFGIVRAPSIGNKISCVEARMERFENLSETHRQIPWLLEEIYRYTVSLRDTACQKSRAEFQEELDGIRRVSDFLRRYKADFFNTCRFGLGRRIVFALLSSPRRAMWKISSLGSKANRLRKQLTMQ